MSKKQNKAGRPRRDESVTAISISLPHALIEKIDKMADAENRSRSNFIANVMAKISKERLLS